jgi:hypothetical protein
VVCWVGAVCVTLSTCKILHCICGLESKEVCSAVLSSRWAIGVEKDRLSVVLRQILCGWGSTVGRCALDRSSRLPHEKVPLAGALNACSNGRRSRHPQSQTKGDFHRFMASGELPLRRGLEQILLRQPASKRGWKGAESRAQGIWANQAWPPLRRVYRRERER